jgi:hypothetical protein
MIYGPVGDEVWEKGCHAHVRHRKTLRRHKSVLHRKLVPLMWRALCSTVISVSWTLSGDGFYGLVLCHRFDMAESRSEECRMGCVEYNVAGSRLSKSLRRNVLLGKRCLLGDALKLNPRCIKVVSVLRWKLRAITVPTRVLVFMLKNMF